MDSTFCVSALESALRRYGRPEIFNTDHGAQFTSLEFTSTLKEAGVQISMDGRGRALDNVFIKRLWRGVKYEEIYVKEYQSVPDLVRSLKSTSSSTTIIAPMPASTGKCQVRFTLPA